jgi:hypothetical protein
MAFRNKWRLEKKGEKKRAKEKEKFFSPFFSNPPSED